ncbi:MAG: hypothetical protein U0641_14355 [Anaerolineae bacterium]
MKRTIREEEWWPRSAVAEIKVNDLASAEQVSASAATSWARPLPDEFVAYIEENARLVYQFLAEDTTRSDEVVPRGVYDGVIEILIGLKALRLRITRRSSRTPSIRCHLPMCSTTASRISYSRRTCWRRTSGILLVKLGRKSLNVAAPKLETRHEQATGEVHPAPTSRRPSPKRDVPRQHARRPDDAQARRQREGVRDANASRTMAEVCGDIDAAAVDAAIDVARQFWLHYRQTERFHALVAEIVEGFFERYGERDVRALLEKIAITQDVILEEALHFAIPVIEQGAEARYLERRIRKRLGAFAQFEE